jgi:hypothetical protein
MTVSAKLFFSTVSKVFVMLDESQKRRLPKQRPKMTMASYLSNILQSTSRVITTTGFKTMPRNHLSAQLS